MEHPHRSCTGERRRLAHLAMAIAASLALGTALAQVPPTADELKRQGGLHLAAHRGDVKKILALTAAGAALNATDPHGRTPLHVATFARRRDSIQALAQAGADLGRLENDRYDAVTIAAVANDEETLALLLSLGASARQVTSRYDGTALIAAAHLGNAGVVRQLIRAGAPLDHVNNLHWTAVIEAIVLGDGSPRYQATLQALIDAGANLQFADREGRTPLQLARSRGYTAMAAMLEQAGAR
ncbi:ankyrin repeat domain-containing protein [Ramlibacter sp.]|uniref:ankyrin repeat domain-containing protein n=1 Tax=Ramlibacter sp. TaxID=1917967 RepID=UPI002D6D1D65|nr:ankyrin repeat domain-containing protein [Ramlibacter sp.]HYD75945.1 ankyrin repeat domain-containing protein [Ramlibacter sp.]